ncbi:hypothetical protein LZ017_17470 [Pelomonas sp. CA6]|uniref:hypothetical protein n=1 Tax=Pelomonas sp. CA6 TaxID=2907999 RepID=UPI001F4C0208|nr:hypothetical protein [Pelomonas sp. CA6]MCH7345175.1 hypothetical protein [Pelomonas sp. CA6]
MSRLSKSPTHTRKNLVILRAGDGSLHRGWIAEPNRDFDLLISYYGKQPGTHEAEADYYEHRPGPKWSCIAELLAENPALLDRYEAFWFPDDDLAATTESLNRMFALFHGLNLALAQPALTPDSYYSWDTLLQRPEFLVRHVAFVEVMAPLFERSALRACVGTFSKSRSGWGLDWVWPTLAGRGRPDAIAIIDATPVKHTRPLGGDLYRNNPEMDPRRDEERLLQEYGLEGRRFTGKYQLNSVVSRHAAPWWLRLKLALRRLNGRRRYRRTQRRAAAR